MNTRTHPNEARSGEATAAGALDFECTDLRELARPQLEFIASDFVAHRSIAATLFFQAFELSDPCRAVRMLDEVGIVARLFPEFDSARRLTLDERWHGEEPVGELCYRYLAVAKRLTDEQPLSRPHYNTLLLTAAFLAQLGRKPGNDDATEHSVVRRDGQRYELGSRDNGFLEDGFRRVRFSGHERAGAQIFAARMTEQPIEAPFSQGEIAMASRWIKLLARPLQLARESRSERQSTIDESCRNLLAKLYANELLNERIPARDAVLGLTHLARVRHLTGSPQSIENRDPLKSWGRWEEIWREEGHYLDTVIESINSAGGELVQKNRAKLRVPLVGGTDWDELGIPLTERKAAQQYLRENLARYESRVHALRSIHRRFPGKPLLDSDIQRIAAERPGYRNRTALFQGLGTESHYRDPDGRYSATYFQAVPIRQFTSDTTLNELGDHISKHPYPAINRWLTLLHSLQDPSPLARLHELVCLGPFANLPALNTYLERSAVNPLDVANGFASQTKIAKIIANLADGERETTIFHGFQSKFEHSGSGFWHIIHQRMLQLLRHFRRPDEAERVMIRRFLEDGLVFVAGTATLSIPGARDPNRYSLLSGALRDDNQFLTLVLDREYEEREASHRLVTAYYHHNIKELRSALRSPLSALLRFGTGVPSEAKNAPRDYYDAVNDFLQSWGAKPLTQPKA